MTKVRKRRARRTIYLDPLSPGAVAQAARLAKQNSAKKLEGGSRLWRSKKPSLRSPDGGPVRAALYVLQDRTRREADRQMARLVQEAKERHWSVVMKVWEHVDPRHDAPRVEREHIFRAAREGFVDVVVVWDTVTWVTEQESRNNEESLRTLLGDGVGFVAIPRLRDGRLDDGYDLTKPRTRTQERLAVSDATTQGKRFLRLFGPNEEGAAYAIPDPGPEWIALVDRLQGGRGKEPRSLRAILGFKR